MTFNYETKTGNFSKGFVQTGQSIFKGNFIEMLSENEYIIQNANYTTCSSCPAAWSLTSKKIEADLQDSAKVYRPVLNIANIPVFIFPNITIPLKTNRQSGLLFPKLEFTKSGGTTVALKYFKVLTRSQDFTLTAKNYQARGWKGLFEYRFKLDRFSYGYFRTAYTRDNAFKNNLSDSGKAVSRSFIDYEQYLRLPNKYTQRTKLHYVRDLRYVRDFADEVSGYGEPSLENKLSVTKNANRYHSSVEASFNINLLDADPYSKNETAVHRLPEIRYSLVEQRLVSGSNLLAKLDLQYNNFTRQNFSYDDICNPRTFECNDDYENPDQKKHVDVKRDGVFDPKKDLIRSGQRLIYKPALSYPFTILGAINIEPSLSLKGLNYIFTPDSNSEEYFSYATNRYLQTDISARTSFSRIFRESQAVSYKHDFEPSIHYSYRPWISRSVHPFFENLSGLPYAISEEKINDKDFLDKNGIQFDYHDRIFDKKILKLSLANRVIRRKTVNRKNRYKKIAVFNVSQYYDMNQLITRAARPWSDVDALLNVRLDRLELYSALSFSPYSKAITDVSSRIRLYNSKRNYFEIAQTKVLNVDDSNRVSDISKRNEIFSSGVGWKSNYVSLNGNVHYSTATKDVQSWEYAATVTPPGKCWSIQLVNFQKPGAEVNYRVNFHFDFDKTPN